MKKTILFSALAIAAGSFTINSASAQIQWTPEQKAVWATENEIFNDFANNNMQDAYSHYDENYYDWNSNVPIPVNKETTVKYSDYGASQGGKTLVWSATPLVIWVKGDLAYVDYYYNYILQDKDGKKSEHTERWTDILMNENGKWMEVGDHGGAVPAPSK